MLPESMEETGGRATAREWAQRTRTAQGLPATVADATVLNRVAAVLRLAHLPLAAPCEGSPRQKKQGGQRVHSTRASGSV